MRWWDDYVGMPFESKGRTRDGCDCYGLLRIIYSDQLGVELPLLLLEYENTLQRKTMNDMMRSQPLLIGFEQVELSAVQPLDVLVLRNVGFDCHIGIVTGGNWMIHSEAGKGTVLEDFSRPHVKPRVKEAWRYVR